jgi:monoterpene epsilon-lactone hydrolase
MSSLQAKIIYTILRRSWLNKGELNKTNLLKIRKRFTKDKHIRFLFAVSGVSINQTIIEGVEVEEFTTDEMTNKVILYAPGGGFVFGRVYPHIGVMSRLSKQAKVKIISVNYKLAPENIFPTQIHEIEKVYLYLLQNGYSPQDIYFAGDSAGTNLIISTALLLKKNKTPLPQGIILISPTTDGTFSYPSFEKKQSTETMLSQQKLRFFYDSYKGQENVKNPLISPVFGDLRGLPETQIFVSENELLFGDATNFFKKLQETKVTAELHVGRGLWHAYPFFAKYVPEAQQSINEMVKFISKEKFK